MAHPTYEELLDHDGRVRIELKPGDARTDDQPRPWLQATYVGRFAGLRPEYIELTDVDGSNVEGHVALVPRRAVERITLLPS